MGHLVSAGDAGDDGQFYAQRLRNSTESVIAQLLGDLAAADGPVTARSSLRPIWSDPALGTEFARRAGRLFGIEPDQVPLEPDSTVASLSVDLRRSMTSSWSCLQPAAGPQEPSGPTTFYLHSASGNAFALGAVRPCLPGRIVGVRAAGLEGECEVPGTIDAFARHYLEQILAYQPAGPYRLCGFSDGGVLAHEIAGRLRRAGAEVDLLALFDSYAPPASGDLDSEDQLMGGRLHELLRRVGYPVHDSPLPDLATALRLLKAGQALPADADEQALTRQLQVYARLILASARHQPTRFDGTARYFRAECPDQEVERWRPLVGALDVHDVGGEHYEHELFASPAFTGPFTRMLGGRPEAASGPGPGPVPSPPGGIEVAVREAWIEVLGDAAPGSHDSFFSCGGNSLTAAHLATRLTAVTNVGFSLEDCLRYPTIAAQAGLAAERAGGQANSAVDIPPSR